MSAYDYELPNITRNPGSDDDHSSPNHEKPVVKFSAPLQSPIARSSSQDHSMDSLPPCLKPAKQRTPTPYPMDASKPNEEDGRQVDFSGESPTPPDPVIGPPPILSSIPHHLNPSPTKQRVPTPYPIGSFNSGSEEQEDESSGLSIIRASAARSVLDPHQLQGGKQPSPFEDLASDAHITVTSTDDVEGQDESTVRPIKKQKMYSSLSGLRNSFEPEGVRQEGDFMEDLPARPSAPEPGSFPSLSTIRSIPSEPSSRASSVSPPASLDIFNPFDHPAHIETSLSFDGEIGTAVSTCHSSSLSPSSTVLSDSPISGSSPKKWEEAFDDDIDAIHSNFTATNALPGTAAFESPFFNESAARAIGSKIGLGLPSTTLVTLSSEGSPTRDEVIGESSDGTSEIVLNGPLEMAHMRIPSWDFGDEGTKEGKGPVSVWGNLARWLSGVDFGSRELVHFGVGGSALVLLGFSLHAYSRRR